jgi:hypothetical protein
VPPVKARARITTVAVCALAILSFSLAAKTAAAAATDPGVRDLDTPGFCGPHRQVRDFGFSSLPPVNELDSSKSGEELGHPHVQVEGGIPGLHEVRSVNRPGKFGYRFVELGSTNPVFVNWTVTETMWAVDSHGGHAVEVGHTGVVVNSINVQHEVSIGLSPPHREGFYRVDLRIIARGKVIGTYSSYLKMVRQSARARLQLEHRVVPAGGRVRWRIGDLGTEPIYFGGEPAVQRMESGLWTRAHGVAEGESLLLLFGLFPGGEGQCGSYHLPADLAPGRYRLVEEVELFRWPRKKPIHVKLKAPFTVLAPGGRRSAR